MVAEEHITAFGWAHPQDMDDMVALTLRINDFLTGLFLGVGITLVDFKIELGIAADGALLLADEISPDTCRLWDRGISDDQDRILDKDRFRQDLGGVVEAYGEVLKRVQGVCPTPRRYG
jgi:phosphoribosylaminoimidazole-succinocarboxamide synthase